MYPESWHSIPARDPRSSSAVSAAGPSSFKPWKRPAQTGRKTKLFRHLCRVVARRSDLPTNSMVVTQTAGNSAKSDPRRQPFPRTIAFVRTSETPLHTQIQVGRRTPIFQRNRSSWQLSRSLACAVAGRGHRFLGSLRSTCRMLPTDPARSVSRLRAVVVLFPVRPEKATLSIPVTAAPPAPKRACGVKLLSFHGAELIKRNSPPVLNACLPLVQLRVSP